MTYWENRRVLPCCETLMTRRSEEREMDDMGQRRVMSGADGPMAERRDQQACCMVLWPDRSSCAYDNSSRSSDWSSCVTHHVPKRCTDPPYRMSSLTRSATLSLFIRLRHTEKSSVSKLGQKNEANEAFCVQDICVPRKNEECQSKLVSWVGVTIYQHEYEDRPDHASRTSK